LSKNNRQVEEIIEKYAAGSRAGHRGFFRKEKSGAMKYHPETGIRPEVREKQSLERKLAKRRLLRGGTKGKKKKKKSEKSKKKKVRGELSKTLEETDPTKKQIAQKAAAHSLKRLFEG